MVKQQPTDFKAMTVAAIKKYLQERGVSVNGYLKSGLVEIAVAVEKMMSPLDPNFETASNSDTWKQRLYIHEVQIDDPFSMTMKNDFTDSPPFGLYDIFNHLIYHATEYDKQSLASYKSFDDYRLFQDGYVRALKTVRINDAGVHVYVGQVQPSMRTKTDGGKTCYSLWFILEGRGANKGSVIDAFCECKGGRDGGCKHIAASMYSLDELLNQDGSKSVTSGPCLWMPKPQSSSEPCSVDHLEIIKIKPPSAKQRKRKYSWLQNIDFDPRSPKHQKVSTTKKEHFTKTLTAASDCVSSNDETPPPKPVVLPLLQKLYLKQNKENFHNKESQTTSTEDCTMNKAKGIMRQKVETYIQQSTDSKPEEFLKTLQFTDAEINHVEEATRDQWQCEDWYKNKVGFISASKCKDVCTRQTTLEKTNECGITVLANAIATEPKRIVKTIANNPFTPQNWGLKHEESAKDSYLRVQKHLHYNAKLVKMGFLISKKKPFMGASADNIRICECARDCKDTLVEYKCPWVHRNIDPKEAFLTKEIGGVKVDNVEQLRPDCRYYYQVQMTLFVTELDTCDFVVWTSKGIHCVKVDADKCFMGNVLLKLEKFWLSQVVPVMFDDNDTMKEKGQYDVETFPANY